jgi:hypothetical protein
MPTETLIELTDIPASDPGAPEPEVYANERAVMVVYRVAQRVAGDAETEACGVVVFGHVNSHVFGSPNDEALQGHRLAKYGLRPYSFWEVKHSTWIAELCARNRVHPYHQDARYEDLRHFVLTFHDSTFEVAARSYSATVEPGGPLDCITRRLRDRDTWN